MLESDEVLAEPIRVTPGFIAFLGLIFIPAIAAFAIFLGAWLVSGEVYAAEAAAEQSTVRSSASFGAAPHQAEVEGWKRALVGVCPLH